VDFPLMVADVEKKKKMLVGYHHPKLVIVADVIVAFLVHPMAYHDLKVYNIQPIRRRSSKLHTVRIKKKKKKGNSKFDISNPPVS
jgi:hypothetical protein